MEPAYNHAHPPQFTTKKPSHVTHAPNSAKPATLKANANPAQKTIIFISNFAMKNAHKRPILVPILNVKIALKTVLNANQIQNAFNAILSIIYIMMYVRKNAPLNILKMVIFVRHALKIVWNANQLHNAQTVPILLSSIRKNAIINAQKIPTSKIRNASTVFSHA